MKQSRSTLLVVENLPVPFDRRVWTEATTLRDDGWDVAVICPKGGQWRASYEVIDGIRIYRHALSVEGVSKLGFAREYGAALLAELRLARRAWRERPFDVIHICNPPDLLFIVALWQRVRHGVKVVFDQHDLGPELYAAKYGARGAVYRLAQLAERATYRTAHRVIATNQSYRDIAVSRGRKDPRHVVVVRSAPVLDLFQPRPPMEVHRRGRRYLVGYLGVMGKQDGVDYLLRAARCMVNDAGRTDVQFMLIGGGPELPSLQRYADELGISDVVEFTGRIPDDEMIERLSSTDVCVSPDPQNGFNEYCTMNKVLEYMALGRPIVQFDLLESRRSAGDAAAYAPPNDERALALLVSELLDEPQRRAAMGDEGRRRMEAELEWSHQAVRLRSLYDALL